MKEKEYCHKKHIVYSELLTLNYSKTKDWTHYSKQWYTLYLWNRRINKSADKCLVEHTDNNEGA